MVNLRALLLETLAPVVPFTDTGQPLFVQSTILPTKWGVIVLNPDGSNIAGGSGGGGADTQYADGAAVATPIGNSINWNDAGTQRAVSAAKPLPVTVGNATLAVTQSGTWNVTNISGTVSLPSGASTAAKQPALGTAGSAATDVISIQGIASMTPVQVTLGAETTKVIGVVRTADGAGNLLTSTGQALDVNLKTSSITLNISLAAETTKVIGVVRTADGSGNLLTSTGQALDVNIKTSAASNMSVNMAQVGGTNVVTAGVAGTQAVGGNVATNVAIGTNPINLGAQAISAENSAVTATRMVQLVADLTGKQIVLPYANPELFISSSLAAITNSTTHSLFAAQGAGVRTYITQLIVTNSHATVGTLVSINDGASGTTLAQGYCAPAGGGFTATFPVPLKGTANTLVEAICGTSGANVYVSGSGYKGA